MSFLTEYQKKTPVDFVLWTGDNVRHDRDPSIPMTMAEIINETNVVVSYLQKAFPNTTIVPGIGNNDVFPHD